jgi:ATP-dependent DNA helicase PIF1
MVTARNDPYINPHNRLQLQGWRANVNLKPVLSIHAALQYISKYVSRAESRSESFTKIFNQILNNSNPNNLSLVSIQKLLLNNVSERDISAQETCHLLSLPLYHSSWTFVSLNLNEVSPRWICGTSSGLNGEELFINNAGYTNQLFLKKYWNGPNNLKDLSLFVIYLTYKCMNNDWKRCSKEKVVHIWSQPSGLRNGPQWEEFCRIKVLLYILHQSIIQLNENNLPWSIIYYQHMDMINKGPEDLIREPVNNEKQPSDDKSKGKLLGDEEQEEFWYDWMYLAEMGPNTHINSISDLRGRDMDRNHNWINEPKTCYSVMDLEIVGDFVQ